MYVCVYIWSKWSRKTGWIVTGWLLIVGCLICVLIRLFVGFVLDLSVALDEDGDGNGTNHDTGYGISQAREQYDVLVTARCLHTWKYTIS